MGEGDLGCGSKDQIKLRGGSRTFTRMGKKKGEKEKKKEKKKGTSGEASIQVRGAIDQPPCGTPLQIAWISRGPKAEIIRSLKQHRSRK